MSLPLLSKQNGSSATLAKPMTAITENCNPYQNLQHNPTEEGGVYWRIQYDDTSFLGSPNPETVAPTAVTIDNCLNSNVLPGNQCNVKELQNSEVSDYSNVALGVDPASQDALPHKFHNFGTTVDNTQKKFVNGQLNPVGNGNVQNCGTMASPQEKTVSVQNSAIVDGLASATKSQNNVAVPSFVAPPCESYIDISAMSSMCMDRMPEVGSQPKPVLNSGSGALANSNNNLDCGGDALETYTAVCPVPLVLQIDESSLTPEAIPSAWSPPEYFETGYVKHGDIMIFK